jgi:hypothetical protein
MLLKMRAHTISSLSLYLPRLQLHHNKSEKIGCTSNTVYLDEHFIIYSSIDWKGTNQKWFPFLLQKTVNNIWASVRRAPIKHGGASYYKNTTKFVLHTYIGPNKTIINILNVLLVTRVDVDDVVVTVDDLDGA